MATIYNSLNKCCHVSFLNPGLLQFVNVQPGLGGVIFKRNTFVLKRKYPVKLVKKGVTSTLFRARNYIYDLVENTESSKHPQVQVILNKFVDAVGQKGELVTVKKLKAYNELLLPRYAKYATPEAVENAKQQDFTSDKQSSIFAPMTAKYLNHCVLKVTMNCEVEWTIEPWHVRVAFRNSGVYVPLECIQILSQPVKGPNLKIQGKCFLTKVTINNRETAIVRCLVHHWSNNPGENFPYPNYSTDKLEAIFAEDEEMLNSLPPPISKTKPQ